VDDEREVIEARCCWSGEGKTSWEGETEKEKRGGALGGEQVEDERRACTKGRRELGMLEGRGADDPDCGNEKISDDSSRVALSFERRTKGKGKKSVSSAYRRPNCSSWRRALSGLLLLLDDTVDSFAEHAGAEGRREEEGTRTKTTSKGWKADSTRVDCRCCGGRQRAAGRRAGRRL
jgi:hypothetical protein